MNCPNCKNTTIVVDSRDIPGRNIKYRRRSCTKCKYRWTTYEISEEEIQELLKASKTEEDVFKGMRG